MYVGISAAGVFRSENGGETWTPANQGTAADFLPTSPGASVHKLLAHPTGPSVLAAEPLRRLPLRRPARAGSGSRATGSRAASASRSRSTTAIRTPPSSSPREPGEPGHAQRRLGVYRTRDGGSRGSCSPAACPSRPGARSCARASPDRLDPPGIYLGTQRLAFRLGGRGRELARGRLPAPADTLGRSRVVVVLLPSLLAAEAGGRKRFEADARRSATRSARSRLRASSTTSGSLRALVNVYVDGVDARDRDGWTPSSPGSEEIRLVAAIAGGSASRTGRRGRPCWPRRGATTTVRRVRFRSTMCWPPWEASEAEAAEAGVAARVHEHEADEAGGEQNLDDGEEPERMAASRSPLTSTPQSRARAPWRRAPPAASCGRSRSARAGGLELEPDPVAVGARAARECAGRREAVRDRPHVEVGRDDSGWAAIAGPTSAGGAESARPRGRCDRTRAGATTRRRT